MTYVDSFVAAVPTDKRAEYLSSALLAAPIFEEHGAIRVVECWGDDVPDGELTSFPMAVKCAEGETVVLSWVEWPSKEVRDAGMAKMMEDPRMASAMEAMPFDGKRLIFGGFDMISDRNSG